MSTDAVRLFVALGPIVIVLVLLLVRVASLWAGVAGLAAALLGAAFSFPLTGPQIAAAASGMAPTVVEVAFILLGGVGLAEAMTRGGAQDRIAGWLAGAESGADRTTILLLLVYGMTPFMESVTGFGLGVVITAPLLIRLGLTPVKAVVSGLLGLVLVPWGSLGPGMLISAQLGGQDFGRLGVWSAVLSLPVLLVSMVAVLWLNVGHPSGRQLVVATAVVLGEWGVLIGANLIAGPPLAGVLAGAAVIAGLLGATRLAGGRLPAIDRALVMAMVPYLVLVGGILLLTALLSVTGSRGRLGWLASPALWVVVAAVVAIALSRGSTRQRWRLVGSAVARWVPIAGNALVFMVLGIVMATTGMAEHLAETAARVGFGFVAAIPAVGALGGYLTGSNTGSAAMFSTATTTAALGLGASPLVALAGQNVAGSIAIIASPPRIALAVGVAMPDGARLPRSATALLLRVVAGSAVALGVIVLLLG